MNVVGPILHFGKTRPNAPALIEGERTISYHELAMLVARTAGHLAALGLQRGDRVGLCLKDTAAHVVALLAAARLGAVAVPLDWRARPAENARFVHGLGLKRVLAEPDARLTADCPAALLDAAWHRAVALSEPGAEAPIDWHDPFVISASSGSTGAPKFTLMTHLQYHFAMAGMFEVMGLAGRHRFLSTLPLYYSGGRNSCLAHLLRGDCVILYPSLFRPGEYLDVAHRERATVGVVVPSVVRQLLATGGDTPLLPGMTALFCTGAPLHPEEKRQALRKLTPNFHERYGTAETLVIAVLRPGDFADRAESVGQPHSLAEIEVVDDDDRPLPCGAVGRFRYRGPGLGSPLFGEPSGASFRGGWYYPGEIARLDERDFIFLQGRASDVIMRSGTKIYPAEIEQVLREHPDILEVAVIGQPAADNEEEVVAFVVARQALPMGELIAHCRTHLTAHKVPRRIFLVPELPRNTSGKVDKISLAQRSTMTAIDPAGRASGI
jgi:acyl-coenzyme A synthetase/AMP-(fatty) acid ligase